MYAIFKQARLLNALLCWKHCFKLQQTLKGSSFQEIVGVSHQWTIVPLWMKLTHKNFASTSHVSKTIQTNPSHGAAANFIISHSKYMETEHRNITTTSKKIETIMYHYFSSTEHVFGGWLSKIRAKIRASKSDSSGLDALLVARFLIHHLQ